MPSTLHATFEEYLKTGNYNLKTINRPITPEDINATLIHINKIRSEYYRQSVTGLFANWNNIIRALKFDILMNKNGFVITKDTDQSSERLYNTVVEKYKEVQAQMREGKKKWERHTATASKSASAPPPPPPPPQQGLPVALRGLVDARVYHHKPLPTAATVSPPPVPVPVPVPKENASEGVHPGDFDTYNSFKGQKELENKVNTIISIGDPKAMYELAKKIVDGKQKPNDKNYRMAIRLLNKAINKGDIHAMILRADMHINGLGGPKNNYAEAISLYDIAMQEANNPRKKSAEVLEAASEAMSLRASMHLYGQGNEDNKPNYEEAITLFERAIKLGNASAMSTRGYMHYKGLGGAKNYPEALALWEKAGNLGFVEAIYNCAIMYHRGLGVDGGKPNNSKAIEFFDRAINLGDVPAMKSRADMHEKGLGGEKNPDEAKRLRQLIITTKEGGMREDGMIGDTEAMKARLNAALAKGTYPSGSSNMP